MVSAKIITMLRVLRQEGQASVEYILLIIVMISLSITFFHKVEGYILTNPDSMLNKYFGVYLQTMGASDSGSGISGQYKRFSMGR